MPTGSVSNRIRSRRLMLHARCQQSVDLGCCPPSTSRVLKKKLAVKAKGVWQMVGKDTRVVATDCQCSPTCMSMTAISVGSGHLLLVTCQFEVIGGRGERGETDDVSALNSMSIAVSWSYRLVDLSYSPVK